MNGQEPNFRKIDLIGLVAITIIMFVVSYSHTAAFTTDPPVQNSPVKAIDR